MNTNYSYIQSRSAWNQEAINTVAEMLKAEYEAHKARYDGFQEMRENTDVTARNVRIAMVWTQVSIKTDTSWVDAKAGDIASGNFADLKDYTVGSTDGDVKWEHVNEQFPSDMADDVAENLENGSVEDAIARLAGRSPDGDDLGTTYLRTVKGSLIPYFLGYDRLCLDSRIVRTLRPALEAVTTDELVGQPDTESPDIGRIGGAGSGGDLSPNPYRQNEPNRGVDRYPVVSHSGLPDWDSEKSWLEDRLKWNPSEYHNLTWGIVEELAERSGVPAGLVPQVAFNTEGNRTFHETLYELLE